MARFLPSGLAVQISGSMGGVVYDRDRFGSQTVRNKATAVHGRSVASDLAKARLQKAAQSWRALTDAQRLTWASAADGQNQLPHSGRSRKWTGFTLFCSIQINRMRIGVSPSTLPPLLQPGTKVVQCVSTIDVGTSSMSAIVPALNPSGAHYVVSATVPFSAGRSSWRGLAFHDLASLSSSTTTNLWSAYSAQWFTLTASNAGMVVAVRTQPISQSGWSTVSRVDLVPVS